MARHGQTALREFYEHDFRPRHAGWIGPEAESAIEEFIRCYELDADKRLEVPCDALRESIGKAIEQFEKGAETWNVEGGSK